MVELNTLARPYARAAFEFALDGKDLDGWLSLLNLAAEIAADPQVNDLLTNPTIADEQTLSLFMAVGGKSFEGHFAHFLSLLCENKRLTVLPDILNLFLQLKAHHERTVDVELTSAIALNEAQQEIFAKKLKAKLGRNVTLHNTIDASLIGGVIVKAEDLVIDGSVRGKIAKLADTLAS